MNASREFSILRWNLQDQWNRQPDQIAVEEPLEIRLQVDGFSLRVTVTMRTPGNDEELALGFLWSEGLLPNFQAVQHVRRSPDPRLTEVENVVIVELKEGTEVDWRRLNRRVETTSSCGLCGRQSLASLELRQRSKPQGDPWPKGFQLNLLARQLRQGQSLFGLTGGVHASALFDYSGNLLVAREDVGRHNALDKVVGWCLQNAIWPASQTLLLVSGRISQELVQKAILAGIPNLIGIGAPSSLAIEMAREFEVTLLGFLRSDQVNVYSGEARLPSRTAMSG